MPRKREKSQKRRKRKRFVPVCYVFFSIFRREATSTDQLVRPLIYVCLYLSMSDMTVSSLSACRSSEHCFFSQPLIFIFDDEQIQRLSDQVNDAKARKSESIFSFLIFWQNCSNVRFCSFFANANLIQTATKETKNANLTELGTKKKKISESVVSDK